MRPIVLCLAAAFLLVLSAPAHAASITVERTSVCVQSICVFGTSNAALPNLLFPAPITVITAGVDTGARLNSMRVCLITDPACPASGSTPVGPLSNIRFTDVDLVCPAGGPSCTSLGLGFTFSGHLNGSFIFDFLLSDLSVSLAGTSITGNLSLELIVDGVSTSSFLPFNTLSGAAFGPVAPIVVGGHNVPYSAFGTLIIAGMPAGSELQILHSGDFRFAPVPEPSTLALSFMGLAGLWRLRKGIGKKS